MIEPARILVAVGGGIAAYKVPELVRGLVGQGHSVRCVLTEAAGQFVTPLVLQTLTGESVRSGLLDVSEEGEIDHIRLADQSDLVIVAPATADLMARMAHGLANDLVAAVLLATRAPVLIAPAMNVNMWSHPATQRNLELLRERGVLQVGPDSGELACGWEGLGRMASPASIVAAADRALSSGSLSGQCVLVTAGGTTEPIDTVRGITNRSSGKMGFALAAEAARRGAEVVLIAGATSLPTPEAVRRVDVGTALEMRAAVLQELEAASIVIKAAAVADFRPREASDRKIKKEALADSEAISLELVRNPDILKEICEIKGTRIVVGFAAESHDVIEAARRKIQRKGCDLLVANDISRADAGFSADLNAVHLITPNGAVEDVSLRHKSEVAAHILDRIEKIRGERDA
ncbi:bifunctional phosphopantothenoylcysteine decarboxylase/phosphopantothenate--cysteine ligase CoaBC [Myxococcota bacterium]|nr:bifunctional phosphopantothenoylcysteine decarboxylase/phosphopantothenate--cysteine ligase CoaBC [Myxococcota bacterium]